MRVGYVRELDSGHSPRTERGYIQRHIAECPACVESGAHSADGLTPTLDTDNAASTMRLPNGLRWLGVPCFVCKHTYTFECTETPE
jgi:hypothetical protein